jgi:CheY-like chemotaxis protein
MSFDHGHILVVDDNQVNRKLLERALIQEGHAVWTAENGRKALEMLLRGPDHNSTAHDNISTIETAVESLVTGEGNHSEPDGQGQLFDVVLLDILMPEMDGYETLSQIKADPNLRHIPVIMITAVDEMDSVLRCIEMGATDYLPKPFNAALLHARITASLAGKRLRDLELEYLEQVGYVMDAAAAVENGSFDPGKLDSVAHREDALGQLARTFQKMAHEVRLREERLRQQVQELRIEIDEARQAQKVAEITETEFFRTLRAKADDLRKRNDR